MHKNEIIKCTIDSLNEQRYFLTERLSTRNVEHITYREESEKLKNQINEIDKLIVNLLNSVERQGD